MEDRFRLIMLVKNWFNKNRKLVISLSTLGFTLSVASSSGALQSHYRSLNTSTSSSTLKNSLAANRFGLKLTSKDFNYCWSAVDYLGRPFCLDDKKPPSSYPPKWDSDYSSDKYGSDVYSRLDRIERELDRLNANQRRHKETLDDHSSRLSKIEETIDEILSALEEDGRELQMHREYIVEQGKAFDKNREALQKLWEITKRSSGKNRY